MPKTVYFAHGKESGPWGDKFTALAGVARARGCRVESPDYSSTMDPDERVRMLLALQPPAGSGLILAGSSMGGYVATEASATLKPCGLFLMAPAFFIPGYARSSPRPCAPHIVIVHGWRDDVVPLENSLRFGREHGAQLHVLDSDHRLTDRLDAIQSLFGMFLDAVL